MSLTPRQKEILDFIRGFRHKNGYAPSLEEIRDYLGLSAVSTVHEHIGRLVDQGFLARHEHHPRSISLVPEEPPTGTITVPLVGTVAAGVPIEAVELPEMVTLPEELAGTRETFALRVQGDSMVDDGILDEDLIVVERREEARNGDVVVALIGEDATVKRFFREGSRIRLQPANAQMEALYYEEDELIVRGVVVGLIRRF